MKFDKETFIALAVAGILLVSWAVFYPKYLAGSKKDAIQKNAVTVKTIIQDSQENKEASGKNIQKGTETNEIAKDMESAGKNIPAIETQKLELTNSLVSYRLDALSGSIEGARLLSKQFLKEDGKTSIELYPYKSTFATLQLIGDKFSTPVSLNSEKQGEDTVVITRKFASGVTVVQTFILEKNNYMIRCLIDLRNSTDKEIKIDSFAVGLAGMPPLANITGVKAYSDRMNLDFGQTKGPIKNADPTSSSDTKFINNSTINSSCDWICSSNKFFASFLSVKSKEKFLGATAQRLFYNPVGLTDKKSRFVVPSIVGNLGNVILPANTESSGIVFDLSFYGGPKEMTRVGGLHKSSVAIMHVSYYSWFEFIARPMLRLLNLLYKFAKSYGVAIILLTLIVRIIFWPITQKANKSMRKMQKSQPKIQALRDKYKVLDSDSDEDAKQKKELMGREMMELYRKEGINPAKGCLPILLQIPVFIALYSALDSAVELRNVSFLWCTDLAKPDLVGSTLPFALPILGQVGLHPLVIVMTILMILQQKMTPSNGDPTQQKMMMIMPIIMLFMLYNLPSGLTLYWTVSQIFSILQMKYGQLMSKNEKDSKPDSIIVKAR